MKKGKGVLNPETAVALKYDMEDAAPRVVAKGRHYIAQKIVSIAHEYKVPVVFDEKLAQLLYQVSLDRVIPEYLYELVAEVLAWVYSLDAKHKMEKNAEVTNERYSV